MGFRRLSGVLVVSGVLLGSACGGDDDSDGGSGTSTSTSTTVERGSRSGTTDTTGRSGTTQPDAEMQREVQALLEDAATAEQVIDQFWTTHWTEFFTDEYRSPEIKGGYFGNDSPPCGGQDSDGENNAYYCRPDDYIAWDWYLMASQYEDASIGDSFIYYVMAHEWGHAIQQRLDRSIVSVASELQADCLAAATLVGAARDGTLLFEPGDRGEIFQSISSVADEFEWGEKNIHGSADQRIEAYQLGEREGVKGCLAS